LIALTHWCFIKFGLKCIGVGDSVSQWLEFVTLQCYSGCRSWLRIFWWCLHIREFDIFFQKTLTDSDVGREILPDGWSVTETYALRYVHNGSLYILKGVKTEADIVLNLLVWCTLCSEVSGRDTLKNTSLLRHELQHIYTA
jgi:hypothetical protein